MKEKLYAITANGHAEYFLLAPHKEMAIREAEADREHRGAALTIWEAEEMQDFLKKEDKKPKEYWLSRAREYIVDEIVFQMESAIAEGYGPGRKANEAFRKADEYATKNFPDPEPPYRYDVFETARRYLMEIGEPGCAGIVRKWAEGI